MSYVIRDAVAADLPAIREIYNDAVINTNIASLNSQRNLSTSQSALSTSLLFRVTVALRENLWRKTL